MGIGAAISQKGTRYNTIMRLVYRISHEQDKELVNILKMAFNKAVSGNKTIDTLWAEIESEKLAALAEAQTVICEAGGAI